MLATRLHITGFLSIVLVPLFGLLDVALYPRPIVVRLFAIRLAMVALTILMIVAVRTRRGRGQGTALGLYFVCVNGFGIALMTAITGGGSSVYYAGINLVMLASAVVIPFSTAASIASVVLLIGGYAALSLGWAGVPDERIFLSNLFFLWSTGFITVVSHRVMEGARRRDLLQRVALEEAGRHRDEFLANVTHELRTPLAAILGFCDMMSDYMTDVTVEQRAWLDRIRENALTLYRLIVQLLDFSKLEAGAMRLASEPVALEPIVRKVAGDMRAIAGPTGVAVDVAIAADPLVVDGDGERVEEILHNLAANALKFADGHPIRIVADRTTIDAEPWHRIVPDPGPSPAREYARIAVVDQGTGIRVEDLRRLFVAFQQLDGSSTRRQGGTGLGLAISARLAAAMGGHIAVRSTPGAGSTFAFLVPIGSGGREVLAADVTPALIAEADATYVGSDT